MPQQYQAAKLSLPLLIAGLAGAAILTTSVASTGSPGRNLEADWLSQLAREGDDGAQLQLGLAYREGRYGLQADARTGLYWLTASAKQENGYAADLVANAYARGEGCATDPEQALHWWRVAANLGNADAQRHLGDYLLANGWGAEGIKWLRQAADRGDSAAHTQLTELYRKTYLPAADLHRGENRVAALGERLDATGLKAMFALWDTIESSSTTQQFAETLQARAEEGDPLAAYQLGLHFRDGAWAVARDPEQAHYWLQRAAAAGNQLAVRALAEPPEL